MREILFRGKRADNGEWVEGSYMPWYYSSRIGKTPAIFWNDDVLCNTYRTPVLPETVGQYTGLTDKNGKYIFEGDIISIPFEEGRGPGEENYTYYENCEVYFDTKQHGWYVKFSDGDTVSIWEYDDLDLAVISNIHDNPELLEVR